MSNFWKSLDLSLIKCEVEIGLSWLKSCIIPETLRTTAMSTDNPAEATLSTGATFQIKSLNLSPCGHFVYKR